MIHHNGMHHAMLLRYYYCAIAVQSCFSALIRATKSWETFAKNKEIKA